MTTEEFVYFIAGVALGWCVRKVVKDWRREYPKVFDREVPGFIPSSAIAQLCGKKRGKE